MFVPLVENWHPNKDDEATNSIISEYLDEIKDFKPDAAILGCTHYPLLADAIKNHLPETELISSGAEAAKALKEELNALGLTNENGGKLEFYTSDDPELFRANATKFVGRLDGDVTHIDIELF